MFVVFCHFPECVLVHIRIKGEVGNVKLVKALQVNILLIFPRRYFFCASYVFCCSVFLMLSHVFIAAFLLTAGKGMASWLLLVMYIVLLLFSHVVSWVRCGT